MTNKVLFLGTNDVSTDQKVSKLATINSKHNYGLVSDSKFVPKDDGYYHTTIVDVWAGGIIEVAKHFDKIVLLDQPVDQWGHWTTLLSTYKIMVELEKLGHTTEFRENDNIQSIQFMNINISIDFISGSHGNYLNFVLNKLLLGDTYLLDDPFSDSGTSHTQIKSTELPVTSWHWSTPWYDVTNPLYNEELSQQYSNHFTSFARVLGENVIRISITPEDILPLYLLRFHRVGDRGIDPIDMATDMYHKFLDRGNQHGHESLYQYYESQLKNFNSKNETVTLDLYNIIRDESEERQEEWPAITQPSDFHDLSNGIQQEYINRFGQPFFGVSEEYPDCPKNVLRNYFKLEFKNMPDNHTSDYFMLDFSAYTNPLLDRNVYYMPYQSFYRTDRFLEEITKIKEFFSLEFENFDLIELHNKFLQRQPYKNTVEKIDNIIQHVTTKQPLDFPELTVIEEAFINNQIEQIYNIEIPIGPVEFPKSVTELVKQYGLNNL